MIDGLFQCCLEEATPVNGGMLRRMSLSTGTRRRPSWSLQRRILENQEQRCFYCRSLFGDVIHYAGKAVVARITWDHVEPFCWQSNNQPLNYVAACSPCNVLKGARAFETPEEARIYVISCWKKKGYASATARV